MAPLVLKLIRNVSLVAAVLLTVYVVYIPREEIPESQNDDTLPIFSQDAMHLVVVACKGSKQIVQETLTMLKSAVVFAQNQVEVHLFTDELKQNIDNELSKWPRKTKNKINIHFFPVKYPLNPDEVSLLKNWWGPCASFRLFLPEILYNIDSVIYVDTDVIFLSAIDDLWNQMKFFKDEQVGALAPRVGWDFMVPSSNPNFILTPEGKLTQVNSGVFLMNLTRMRERRFNTDPSISGDTFSWNQDLLLPLYHKYKAEMNGDQNLINILFHYNPDLLHYLPCKFNYHHKFCFKNDRPGRSCLSAETEGAFVIHGSANTYYNNYSPAFGAINNAFRQYNFENDLTSSLLQPMINNLQQPEVENHEHCGGKTELFTKHIRNIIERTKLS
ncbi:glucoside xylosyltransferase 1-like isoform X1 [Styela clava]